MKDIYTNMTRQNILKYYGSKFDLKLDISEIYDFVVDNNQWVDLVLDFSDLNDFVVDKTEWVDLVLDFSEEYDFQLDNSREPLLPIIYESTVNSNVEYGCDWTILTQDGFSILTQNEECIQYEH